MIARPRTAADKTALIYSPEFGRYSYGEGHPFKTERIKLAFELQAAYGLHSLPFSEIRNCKDVTEAQLTSFHDQIYIDRLKEFSSSDVPRADFLFGLGDGENPVFPGFFEWARLGTACTVEAARLVTEEGFGVAFNLAGGYHHAHRSKASGFSYLNDAVIAINYLLECGKRVVYLDLDAHHGDGVQEAFYASNQVLTISLHESGVYFFPGTGFEHEAGEGKGYGYSVNIPFVAHTDDALFMKAFDEVAYPLIAMYNPDVLVTQLGADSFRTDPLTRLETTTHSYAYVLKKLKALRIPWVAMGGGGYDMMNVARAWTIAWGIMNGIEVLPAALPYTFVDCIAKLGYPNRMLYDAMHWSPEDDRNVALDAVEKSIEKIRTSIFPIMYANRPD